MLLIDRKTPIPTLTALVTICVSLAPVFKNYGIWIISLSEIFLIGICILLFITKAKHDFYKIRMLFLFFLVVTVLSLVNSLFYPFAYTVTVRFWIYIFFIYSFCDYYDFELGCKIIVYAVLINSIYLLIQDAVFVSMGKVLQWNLPGLPVKIAEGYINGEAETAYGVRFSGFFSEPAQFYDYALTGVIILLLKKNILPSLYRWISLIIIVYAILLSGSGAGSAQLLIILAIFCLKSFKEGRKNIALVIGLLVFLVVLIQIFIPAIVSMGLDAGWLRAIDRGSTASANSRIYHCFRVFNSFSPVAKIFGIGYGNFGYYVDNFYLSAYTSSYCNSAAYVLCGSGYVGFAFYLAMFYDWFIHTKGIARFKLITLLVSAFYSGQILSIDFVLSACFILSCFIYRKGEKKWII